MFTFEKIRYFYYFLQLIFNVQNMIRNISVALPI